MGRGRAKAKQIKVARKLKYFSPETDLSALQKELGSTSSSDDGAYADFETESEYSDLADKYNDFEDED